MQHLNSAILLFMVMVKDAVCFPFLKIGLRIFKSV